MRLWSVTPIQFSPLGEYHLGRGQTAALLHPADGCSDGSNECRGGGCYRGQVSYSGTALKRWGESRGRTVTFRYSDGLLTPLSYTPPDPANRPAITTSLSCFMLLPCLECTVRKQEAHTQKCPLTVKIDRVKDRSITHSW